MNIAFLYIAEAYQCYHGASIALELAARPNINVVSYYIDPETPRHLERIRLAYGATTRLSQASAIAADPVAGYDL